MGEQVSALMLTRMILIFTGMMLFLFIGEPDIHDAIVEVIRSMAK